MKKINTKLIRLLVFNIAETTLILLIGLSLKIEVKHLIITMLTFMISRACFGTALHFKNWYRCLIWSLLILFSLFTILKVDLIVSVLFSIFSAFIMTGKSNIKDMYLWKNSSEPSKYQDIIDFIKYNELDTKLIEFEQKVKTKSNLEYLIYKYKFKDQKTFSEMRELLDMDTPRIVEQLDKIAFAIRLYCGI